MKRPAIEGILNYRSYGITGYSYNYLRITGLYLVHSPIASVEGLQWYFGGGAMFQSWGGDFDKYLPVKNNQHWYSWCSWFRLQI